jgi:hypothetical protein
MKEKITSLLLTGTLMASLATVVWFVVAIA